MKFELPDLRWGYKVTTQDGWSVCTDEAEGGVFYGPSSPTIPRLECGPLCVFGSYPEAWVFMQDYAFIGERVRRCVYIKSWNVFAYKRDLSFGGDFNTALYNMPTGTKFAEAVLVMED